MTIYIRKPNRSGELAHDEPAFAALPASDQANYWPSAIPWKTYLTRLARQQTRGLIAPLPHPWRSGDVVVPQGVPERDADWAAYIAFQYLRLDTGVSHSRFASEAARETANDELWKLRNQVGDYELAFFTVKAGIDAGTIATVAAVDVASTVVATTARDNPANLVGYPIVFVDNNIGQVGSSYTQIGLGDPSFQVAFPAKHHGVITGARVTVKQNFQSGSIDFQARLTVPGQAQTTHDIYTFAGPNNVEGVTFTHANEIRFEENTAIEMWAREQNYQPSTTEAAIVLFARDTPAEHTTP